VWAGKRVEVRLHAQHLEVIHAGAVVATHERLQERFGERLVLDHYLELLQHQPGALPRARALLQARAQGTYPAVYDQLLAELQRRYGETQGNRQLLAVLLLHRTYPLEHVQQAVSQALELGCCEAEAIAVLVRSQSTRPLPPPGLTDLGGLARYGQTEPAALQVYDALRPSQAGGGQ
jgi:hypothetical protein